MTLPDKALCDAKPAHTPGENEPASRETAGSPDAADAGTVCGQSPRSDAINIDDSGRACDRKSQAHGVIEGPVTADAPTLQQPGYPERDPVTGQWMRANEGAVTTRQHQLKWPSWLLQRVEDYYIGCVQDDAGLSEMSTRRQADVRHSATFVGLITALTVAIQTHGIFDKRGKLRLAWLVRLESLINSATRLNERLGYSRHQRDAMTLSDYINQPTAPSQAPTAAPYSETSADREEFPSPGTDAPSEAQNSEQ